MPKLYTVNYWGSHPEKNNDDCWCGEEFTWHIVVGQGNCILGVFGSAIENMAKDFAKKVKADTGFDASTHTLRLEKKPRVGQRFDSINGRVL